MAAPDVAPAARVASESGWPGKERQFAFFVEHPACRAVVARERGETVGAACGVANGNAGWLGLVVVSTARRGRGLGAALTLAVMERLREAGCRTLLLTATEPGRPVYEKLGFEVETFYHGFEAPGLPSGPTPDRVRNLESGDLKAVLDLDRRSTGEERSALLQTFPAGFLLVDGEGGLRGYHVPMPWGGGPTIAADGEAGLALLDLQRRLAGPEGFVRAWLTSENAEGRQAVERTGFAKTVCLPRMVCGGPLDWRPEALWGVFSLAKG